MFCIFSSCPWSLWVLFCHSGFHLLHVSGRLTYHYLQTRLLFRALTPHILLNVVHRCPTSTLMWVFENGMHPLNSHLVFHLSWRMALLPNQSPKPESWPSAFHLCAASFVSSLCLSSPSSCHCLGHLFIIFSMDYRHYVLIVLPVSSQARVSSLNRTSEIINLPIKILNQLPMACRIIFNIELFHMTFMIQPLSTSLTL